MYLSDSDAIQTIRRLGSPRHNAYQRNRLSGDRGGVQEPVLLVRPAPAFFRNSVPGEAASAENLADSSAEYINGTWVLAKFTYRPFAEPLSTSPLPLQPQPLT
jgi:hypothetical protein